MTKFTIKKSGKRICSSCEVAASKAYRFRLKQKAVEYKGGKCEICGYDKCLRSLVFHHNDPLQKDFAIGESRPRYKKARKWDLVKIELDKCQLLCHNCHNELHDKIETEKDDGVLQRKIHRKNINIINEHLIKERYTPAKLMERIESGHYDTVETLNHRELLHQEWVKNNY